MVSAEAAAGIVRHTLRTMYRWVETGKVHFKETPEGMLLICVNSLANR